MYVYCGWIPFFQPLRLCVLFLRGSLNLTVQHSYHRLRARYCFLAYYCILDFSSVDYSKQKTAIVQIFHLLQPAFRRKASWVCGTLYVACITFAASAVSVTIVIAATPVIEC